MQTFSLYIHIPYCHKICPYCDFNAYSLDNIPEEEYTLAILKELKLQKDNYIDKELLSIYFGGGTPSIFSARSLEKIVLKAIDWFKYKKLEISLEANPEDLSLNKLKDLSSIGINRLSIGAQSMNNNRLKFLKRNHSKEDILQGVENLQKTNISNFNLDLIYCYPNQTREELKEELESLIYLKPKHLSCYTLTIEKGTPFFNLQNKNKITLPKEKEQVRLINFLIDFLTKEGLKHYEISNYAYPGFESKHNLTYWNHNTYLGLGAGAHSFNKEKQLRYCNIKSPKTYLEKLKDNNLPIAVKESLSSKDLAFESLFLGLRKTSGLSLDSLKDKFNTNILTALFSKFSCLEEEGLLEKTAESITLTRKGLLVSDSVLEFLGEILNEQTNINTKRSWLL